ncbi:MAG: phage/plasmid primase, P4 family [Alphaproteobacteria bacterium]
MTAPEPKVFDPSTTHGEKKPKTAPPNKVAEAIMAKHAFRSDCHGVVYRYNGRHWEEITEAQLVALALEEDGAKASKASRRKEIASFIRARSFIGNFIAGAREIPWSRCASSEVACRNVVVDVLTGKTREHNPDDYLERTLPWDWDPSAKCPDWDQALVNWFEDERDSEEALQDFFGYVILPHAKFKKALVLLGESDTGKSRAPLVAKALVGKEATCSLPCESMEDPASLEVIVGKALNIITELPADAMIRDGGFKTLVSTEEDVFVNPKYKTPLSYTPRVKMMIATNTLPRITDKTEATYNRLLVIHFWNVIANTEREIPADEFDRRMLAQMPGILVWAAAGAKRLIERDGKFVAPLRGMKALGDFREAENPFRQFLNETAVSAPNNAVPIARVTELFNKWNNGGKRMTVRQVGDMARKAGQIVKGVRRKQQVFISLLGYTFAHSDDLPDLLHLTDEAARSTAREVDERAPGAQPEGLDGV